jgi:hypothetical protein
LVKGKKKIRRRRKGSGPSKMYFTMDTQAAIVEWQGEEDGKEREKLYRGRIKPAFDKLTENLIFIHRFESLHDSYEDLKSDCVTFLYEQLPKFDVTKGSKAFSYYNIIAKHYLIIKTKQRGVHGRRQVSFDDHESLGLTEKKALEEHCTIPSPDEQIIVVENKAAIANLLVEIKTRFKGELEIKVIDCIQYIFKNAQQLPFLNKRAVFLYIREMTGATPKQLTTVMSNIKKEYRKLRGTDEFGIF